MKRPRARGTGSMGPCWQEGKVVSIWSSSLDIFLRRSAFFTIDSKQGVRNENDRVFGLFRDFLLEAQGTGLSGIPCWQEEGIGLWKKRKNICKKSSFNFFIFVPSTSLLSFVPFFLFESSSNPSSSFSWGCSSPLSFSFHHSDLSSYFIETSTRMTSLREPILRKTPSDYSIIQ